MTSHSPADSKKYKVVRSKGEPKTAPAGRAPAEKKSYKYVSGKGEAPTAHDGVDLSKKFSAKPNLKRR